MWSSAGELAWLHRSISSQGSSILLPCHFPVAVLAGGGSWLLSLPTFQVKAWKLCLGLELTSYWHMATPSCKGVGEHRHPGSPVPSWDPGGPIVKKKERKMDMELGVMAVLGIICPITMVFSSILLTHFPSCYHFWLKEASSNHSQVDLPALSVLLHCFVSLLWYSSF